MPQSSPFFFFNDTATTEIYTLSLHDALPISLDFAIFSLVQASYGALAHLVWGTQVQDAWTLAPTVWTFTFVFAARSEEHTSELQSQSNLVCRLLLEKKKSPRPTPHSQQ